ncbi:MAG: alpha/beta hydrolase [Gammaproteobacteria bacterium]|jgi:acetyl esterase/lipase|nr:alpha/beta hydrolase [Gammaproteobacteria bacterium]
MKAACLIFAAITVVLGISGCSGLSAVNWLTPNAPTVAEKLEFVPDSDLRLDIYGPVDPQPSDDGPPPVVVFLHGGGWQDGTRASYKFVASGLTDRGFMVVIPDMRMFPAVTFPTFVEDAAAAISWTFANISRFGGDPRRVFVLGHSSGAHVAALLNYDERYLALHEPQQRLCGMIGLAGPYDFLPLVSPTLKKVFPDDLRYQSQPINFVDGTEAPALLLHGMQDRTVKPRNSAALNEQVASAGGNSRFILYDDSKHAALVLALSSSLDFLAPVLADLSQFIESSTCPPEE